MNRIIVRLMTILLISTVLIGLQPATSSRAGSNIWTTSGPFGAYIWSFAIPPDNPDIVYAALESASPNNVYRSLDRGQTWVPSSSGLALSAARAFAFNPVDSSHIYVALFSQGVYQSRNGGNSWEPTTFLTPTRTLATSPFNENLILAGSNGWGIWRSVDGGSSWVPSGGPKIVEAVVSASSDPNVFYACSTDEGVFRSTNAGVDWQPINSSFLSPPRCWSLAVEPSSSDIAYMGTTHEGIWRTVNGGSTWTPIGLTLGCSDIRAIVIDPRQTQTIYVGCGPNPGTGTPGVYRSTDSIGTSWITMQEGMGSRAILSLAVDKARPRVMYAGTELNGIWVRTILETVHLPLILRS